MCSGSQLIHNQVMWRPYHLIMMIWSNGLYLYTGDTSSSQCCCLAPGSHWSSHHRTRSSGIVMRMASKKQISFNTSGCQVLFWTSVSASPQDSQHNSQFRWVSDIKVVWIPIWLFRLKSDCKKSHPYLICDHIWKWPKSKLKRFVLLALSYKK